MSGRFLSFCCYCWRSLALRNLHQVPATHYSQIPTTRSLVGSEVGGGGGISSSGFLRVGASFVFGFWPSLTAFFSLLIFDFQFSNFAGSFL
ncbi:hypothetical protein AZI85_04335 [Bdellovibrio bacteriovorus]|uniref:Uncharacterized protein n=1 Tax=Bdellovibrio bacteriovorus TaxID=959 RepID=A0A150WI94_BDEBC|nr:hypothetical protein AZI85_04335 [Bdellovibrio bacteriovorus]